MNSTAEQGRAGRFLKLVLARLGLALAAIVITGLALEVLIRLAFPNVMAHPRWDRGENFYGPESARNHPWLLEGEPFLRIAVIGDSFTISPGLHTLDWYGAQLEQLLNMNKGNIPVVVDIFGKAGTSTFQQLGLLDTALEKNPDLIILGICLNDTENWAKPRRLLKHRETMITRVPGRLTTWWLQNSRLLHWMYIKTEQRRCSKAFIDYYNFIYGEDYSGWRRFTRAVNTMSTRCREEGVPIVSAVIPLLSLPLGEGQYPFTRQHAIITNACASVGIPCLDLYPAFAGMDQDRLQVIPGVDPHPNEIANRIIAENLLIFLVQKGLIPSAYTPRNSKGPSFFRRWKILARKIQDPLSLSQGTRPD